MCLFFAERSDLKKVFLFKYWPEFLKKDSAPIEEKLYRLENAFWKPPVLKFEVERHGSLARGGTRAEIHDWELNIEKRTAVCSSKRYRQVYPRDTRMNFGLKADELAEKIIKGEEDYRLQWKKDGSVRIILNKIIPSNYLRTYIHRRERLKEELKKRLEPFGWEEDKNRLHVYIPTKKNLK